MDKQLEKRFSEKTIVAFTNNTLFILDFYIYMTKPVWSHVLALSAWTLKKAHHLPGNLSPKLQKPVCKTNS